MNFGSTINTKPALWILMACCFSTMTSVATVLNCWLCTHAFSAVYGLIPCLLMLMLMLMLMSPSAIQSPVTLILTMNMLKWGCFWVPPIPILTTCDVSEWCSYVKCMYVFFPPIKFRTQRVENFTVTPSCLTHPPHLLEISRIIYNSPATKTSITTICLIFHPINTLNIYTIMH